MTLVRHFKCWAVLWSTFALVVEPCGRDVSVPKPFLHIGYIGLMVEGIGCGGCPERVGAEAGDVETQPFRYFITTLL